MEIFREIVTKQGLYTSRGGGIDKTNHLDNSIANRCLQVIRGGSTIGRNTFLMDAIMNTIRPYITYVAHNAPCIEKIRRTKNGRETKMTHACMKQRISVRRKDEQWRRAAEVQMLR